MSLRNGDPSIIMTWYVVRAVESEVCFGSVRTSVRMKAYLGACFQLASVTVTDRAMIAPTDFDAMSSRVGEDPNTAIDASPNANIRVPIQRYWEHVCCHAIATRSD